MTNFRELCPQSTPTQALTNSTIAKPLRHNEQFNEKKRSLSTPTKDASAAKLNQTHSKSCKSQNFALFFRCTAAVYSMWCSAAHQDISPGLLSHNLESATCAALTSAAFKAPKGSEQNQNCTAALAQCRPAPPHPVLLCQAHMPAGSNVTLTGRPFTGSNVLGVCMTHHPQQTY